MSKKFTPGPWAFEKNKVRCEVKMPGAAIALPHRDEANARLISAAPEMYDFINYFLTVGGQSVLRLLPYDIAKKIFDEADRIIRKASGENEAKE